MERNARIIAQFYHYISEGIISFYAILLVLQFSEEVNAPYIPFILILLASAMIFSFFAYLELSAIFYIMMIPVLAIAFYVTGYTLGLILLFSVLLTYRYYRIEQTEIKRREAGYLGASAILVVLLFVMNEDNEILWVYMIQFLITFLGFYISHLMLTSKALRTGLLFQFSLMLGFILLAGVVSYLFLIEVVTRIVGVVWQGIGFITVYLTSIFSWLFAWLRPDPSIYEQKPEVEDNRIESTELGASITDAVESFFRTYIVAALALMIVTVIIFFFILRRTPRERGDDLADTAYAFSSGKMQQQEHTRRSWRDIFKRPEHPARRLVYQFEKKLFKSEHARYSHETLEKWLGRIGDGTELEVYQRVRYGDQEVSEEELNELKQELNNLAERLN